jgi:hypothetical protein
MNWGRILVKVRRALMALVVLLMAFTAVLGYGVAHGCGYCGPAMAGWWGVTLLVALAIILARYGTSGSFQQRVTQQPDCNHQFVREECQKLTSGYGDSPIWRIIWVSCCWQCGLPETGDS